MFLFFHFENNQKGLFSYFSPKSALCLMKYYVIFKKYWNFGGHVILLCVCFSWSFCQFCLIYIVRTKGYTFLIRTSVSIFYLIRRDIYLFIYFEKKYFLNASYIFAGFKYCSWICVLIQIALIHVWDLVLSFKNICIFHHSPSILNLIFKWLYILDVSMTDY